MDRSWFGGVAITAYAAIIAVVGLRADRRRTGFSGIALGAIVGVTAIGIALANALNIARAPGIRSHVLLVLNGFILPTIIGYAYQFFPVPTGQFLGASDRTATATILVLIIGTGLLVVGTHTHKTTLIDLGAGCSFLATVGYAYLLGRRFW